MAFDPDSPAGARAMRRLTSERIAWLTSVSPAGQPQSFPVWFLWEDGGILIYSDHRAKRNANIAANPRVALHLDTDAGGGDVVVVEGEAHVDPGTPPVTGHAAYLAKYGDWIDAQLGGGAAMAEVYSVPIRIRPTRIRASGG
jgi:PPOX class probable F420-dependent enzyme